MTTNRKDSTRPDASTENTTHGCCGGGKRTDQTATSSDQSAKSGHGCSDHKMGQQAPKPNVDSRSGCCGASR